MHKLLEKILANGPILTDGAWGTELQARGLPIGDFPDLWNVRHPERVLEVAQAYVDAGSQIILTNTFGANRIRMAELGAQDQVRKINREGVAISRKAAGAQALVFASIGPTGKLLLSGDVTEEELEATFAEQASALAEAGADGLAVETMSDLAEAGAAVRAAKRTGLPVVACMVFDSGKEKDRTMMGATPEQVAKELEASGADVIGANCGQGIEGFAGVCRRLRAASSVPVWIKPNAGLPVMVDGKTVYHATPEQFAAHIPELAHLGASFLGGCCGTSPAFLRAAGSALRANP
jgi:methionine synthase I (cobalamin-dependent)